MIELLIENILYRYKQWKSRNESFFVQIDRLEGLVNQELSKMMKQIEDSRWQFEMAVEAAAFEVIDISKQISSAIGEVSVIEAKEAIIREFTNRLLH